MPPHSTTLQQEGAVFLSFKLVQGGVFQEEGELEKSHSEGLVGRDAELLSGTRLARILIHS